MILYLYRPVTAPLHFGSMLHWEQGTFQFVLEGLPGLSGRIQRTTDLGDWRDWMPFALGESPLKLSDPEASSEAPQFYRALAP